MPAPPEDKYNWIPVVEMGIDDALKYAGSAEACCDADPANDLDDVKEEIGEALAHLSTAATMLDAAKRGEE